MLGVKTSTVLRATATRNNGSFKKKTSLANYLRINRRQTLSIIILSQDLTEIISYSANFTRERRAFRSDVVIRELIYAL